MRQRRPQVTRGEALVLTVVLTIGAVSLAGIAGVDSFAGALAVVGLVVALPAVAVLGDRLPYVGDPADAERTAVGSRSTRDVAGADSDPDPGDPVAELRDRYARGEIDEAEFERRLERLIETEDLDAAVENDRERSSELE